MRRRSRSARAPAGPERPLIASASGLVGFDRKSVALGAVLLLALILGTALKLHGSSIGIWNRLTPERSPTSGVLWGTPRLVRVDEWSVITPAMVSQARQHPPFPLANESWGAARAPMTLGLPLRHWSAVFRPQYWGFLLLDVEWAFAFYWIMKTVLLVGGLFLLLMLLTNGEFGLSLMGTLCVYFSPYVQWWFSTPAMLPEMVGCLALALVAAHYLARSANRWVILGAGLVLAGSAINFALCLYPPFQVPLGYLGIALLVGSLAPRWAEAQRDWRIRAGSLVLALVIVAVALTFYYDEARATIDLVRHTVYPGARRSLGGEITLAQLFSGFFGFFMTEQSFPPAWLNVCEASNFVLLFPIPLAWLGWRAARGRRVSALEWSLGVYCGLVTSWLIMGWPSALAGASGFGLSQGSRALLGLGLASTLWCCVFVSDRSEGRWEDRLAGHALVGVFTLLVALFSLYFIRETAGFATLSEALVVCAAAGLAAYLLLARHRRLFIATVLVPGLIAGAAVNPVAVGLGPILDTDLYRQVSRITEADPQARWVVFGPSLLADYLKATGANVFNGMKTVPPVGDFRRVDPADSAATYYNRYARLGLTARSDSLITYALVSADHVEMGADPKNPCWRRIGIRYVVLPRPSDDPGFLGIADPVLPLPQFGLWVYRYRPAPAPS
jgi:hypothetical protein